MPMSRVSPVLVLVLTTIIESVRVPQRSLPASEPMSRVLTRGTSAHGSSRRGVGERDVASLARAVVDEHLVDDRRLHVEVAHGQGRRRGDEGAREQRRRAPGRQRPLRRRRGQDCSAVSTIEPIHSTAPTTMPTPTHCSSSGCTATLSAERSRPPCPARNSTQAPAASDASTSSQPSTFQRVPSRPAPGSTVPRAMRR